MNIIIKIERIEHMCCSQNMVGPGEVDGELEGEVTEECTKYGKIIKCLIYEVHPYLQFRLKVFFVSLYVLPVAASRSGARGSRSNFPRI